MKVNAALSVADGEGHHGGLNFRQICLGVWRKS